MGSCNCFKRKKYKYTNYSISFQEKGNENIEKSLFKSNSQFIRKRTVENQAKINKLEKENNSNLFNY
jgi:hypothetical protein